MSFLPIVLSLTLLLARRHVVVAGAAGALLAALVGRLPIEEASPLFLEGLQMMLSLTVPLLYAAAASMVSEAGSVKALVGLASRLLGRSSPWLAGSLAVICGLTSYMGTGAAGATIVVAPLVVGTFGVVPEIIAGMAVAASAGMTVSPAALSGAVTSRLASLDPLAYGVMMRPYGIFFLAAGFFLAVSGAYRSRDRILPDHDGEAIEPLRAVPAVVLLLSVLLGPSLNDWIGRVWFTPLTAVAASYILTVALTPLSFDQAGEALATGAKQLLIALFTAGIFLGTIKIAATLGAFEEAAAFAAAAPAWLILPASVVIGFLLAIPTGASVSGTTTLILPLLLVAGLRPEQAGYVTMAIGFGAQISPVQMNILALSDGFGLTIQEVIRINLPYILVSFALLILASLTIPFPG